MSPVHCKIQPGCLLAPLLACIASAAVAAPGSWSSTGPYGGRIYDLINYEAGSGTLWSAAGGALFRTTSNGSSWQRLGSGLPPTFISALGAASGAPVLYASSGEQMFRSGNGGDLWIPLSEPAGAGSIMDISVQRPGSNSVAILAATTSASGVWITNDGGSTWSGGTLPVNGNYQTVEFAADGSIYVGLLSDPAIFGGAALIKSTDSAASWAAVSISPAPFSVTRMVVSPLNPLRLFVNDEYGGITLTSSNGGTTWNTISLPVGCFFADSIAPHPTQAAGLFITCSSLGAAVTNNVDAPVWTNWGVANGLTVNGTDPVQAISIQSSSNFPTTPNLYLATRDGGLFRSTNGGTNWSEINNGLQATMIRALAPHPKDTGSGSVVLAGYGDAFSTARAIYRSADNGATWAPSLSGLNAEQVRGLTIDPTTVDSDPFTAENFTVYAAGRSAAIPDSSALDGGLYKSTDGGNSWATIDNGIALVNGHRDMGTARAIVADPRSCAAPPPSGPCATGSGGLQTLYAIGSGRPDFSGPGLPMRSARIYKSTNAGASWTASESGLPLPQDLDPGAGISFSYNIGIALVIDPSNTQTLYAGLTIGGLSSEPGMLEPTFPNGVFKSTNGGATWVHSSVGLPHYLSPASSQQDVLALAINPANPAVLYAAVTAFLPSGAIVGTIYKSTNAGASWSESSAGIAGQDVRALLIDPSDASGNTIYAGTGGDGANPGGVYRSTDGGLTWNSYSIGLPAYSSTALAMPARNPGDPARLYAGTNAGVWEFTEVPDEDADGSPTTTENGVLAGDGNGDGTADADQPGVASLSTPQAASPASPQGSSVNSTIEIVTGSACTQLNDSVGQPAELYPLDPLGDANSHEPWGLVHFALPACSASKVRVTFHGANFNANWVWRNYGPRIPGDQNSFGWYTFAGATRIDVDTWELDIDALRQGNYRNDANNILFVGGPGNFPDRIFDNGFQ